MQFASNISLLIDVILQPFVKKCPSFLQDSQNLIQNTYRNFFQKDCRIYSCDFSSLYTSINLDHALNVITDYISRHFHSDEIILNDSGFQLSIKATALQMHIGIISSLIFILTNIQPTFFSEQRDSKNVDSDSSSNFHLVGTFLHIFAHFKFF